MEITVFFKFEMYGISYLLCLIVQNNQQQKMNEHNNNRKEKSGTKFVAKSNKE